MSVLVSLIMLSNLKLEVSGLVVVLENTPIPYQPMCTTVLLNQTMVLPQSEMNEQMHLEKQRFAGGGDSVPNITS